MNISNSLGPRLALSLTFLGAMSAYLTTQDNLSKPQVWFGAFAAACVAIGVLKSTLSSDK